MPQRVTLLLGLLLLLGVAGCSSPKFVRAARAEEARLSAAPPGLALVNFHRPSHYAAGVPFDLWNRTELIGSVSGRSLLQHVCEPGEHVFLGAAKPPTAIRAELRAGGVYDVVVNVTPGWTGAKFEMEVLYPGHPKRIELSTWEQREALLMFVDEEAAAKREDKRREWAAKTLEEFLEGKRSDELQELGPGDGR